MLRFLRLLLVISVLWCGVHVGEPALAHDETVHHQLGAAGHVSDDRGEGEHSGPLDAAHVGHHHCPMAPEHDDAARPGDGSRAGALLFAAPARVLDSLSQAPPLEPPAA